MMRRLASFPADRTGNSAAEFALVLPVMLLFLLGIIDAGRYAWAFNRMEKAAQTGARMAVVTDFVAPGIAGYDYVNTGSPLLTQGDPIPASAFGMARCTQGQCQCVTTPCPAAGNALGYSATSFQRIVDRMHDIDPAIAAANVAVEYRGSGLGFAGDPSGSDIAPLTTVRLEGMQFQPITTLLFATQISLPAVSHTLTMEDGAGAFSN